MCVLNNLVLLVLAIMLKNKNFKSQFSIIGFGGNEHVHTKTPSMLNSYLNPHSGVSLS